ncbi:FAD-dependent oxidoreductase [Hymenobacter cellulosivorans]|uniref:NAD(P)/FAD-dependent oxidoreductase n=1 Tax=Hymenobacter cellulosivorans TaxID=2932249 RepID=A0ABY4FHN8_9BACT|nr:FAD/NAD(P)-binding protein [Hymenobacter cellulosivorans]UOQ55457.1 NAD(P)/FAD-dependent oxidoreductase [Hymenobacter cellulosivorans]
MPAPDFSQCPFLPGRREFLGRTGLSVAGLLLGGSGLLESCAPGSPRAHIRGSLRGANKATGHKLWKPDQLPPSARTVRTDIVIIGGGVAGLSAKRWLHRHGRQQVLLLELDAQVGGNSSSGQNPTSAFPWGPTTCPCPTHATPSCWIFCAKRAPSPAPPLPTAGPFTTSTTSATTPKSACTCTATGKPASYPSWASRPPTAPRLPASSNSSKPCATPAATTAWTPSAFPSTCRRPMSSSASSIRFPLPTTSPSTALPPSTCVGTSTTAARTTTVPRPPLPRPGPACTTSPPAKVMPTTLAAPTC